MATITGNVVHADPDQWFTLDYTFANSKFTWSVTAHASHTSYWNTIYGLTVNVGGNSYYKGDISWQGYTPNTVVYLSTEKLENLDDGQIYIVIGITQMGHNEYSSKNLDHLRKSDIITIGDNSFVMVEFDRIGNYDYWTIIPKEDISADKNQSNAEENTNLEDASNAQ